MLWIATALTYYVLARAGLAFATVHKSATAIWAPTGLSIAAVVLCGVRAWPGIFVGAFAANLVVSGHGVESAAIAVGNTLEALVGGLFVRRAGGGEAAFSSPAGVLRYALSCGILAPMVSATTGVATLYWCGSAAPADAASIWLTWWTGDMAGALLIGPLLIVHAHPPPEDRHLRRGLAERIALSLSALALGLVVFGTPAIAANGASFQFFVLPLVTWAAFRFGSRATSLAAVVLAGFAIAATLARRGPFGAASTNVALLQLQVFLGTVSVTGLSCAAALAELARHRREAADDLRRRVALFDSNPAGVVVIAPDGRIVEANPVFRSMLGLTADEVGGASCTLEAFTPEPWHQRDLAALGALRADGRFESYEKEFRRRGDGAIVPARVGGALAVPETGEAVLSVTDLTRFRELEDELRQAQKLEAIGRLAGGVAHDFNNILTVLQGNAELLSPRVPPSDAEARECLAEMKASLDRASALVRQLLVFARQQAPAAQVILLDAFVRTALPLAQRTLGPGVRLTADLVAAAGHVRIDPVELEQVVLNLAQNARDALSGNGTVHISTSLQPTPDGRQTIGLEFRDDGEGMSEEVRRKALEPFFTTKPVGKGTGLGLPTVFGIVTRAGGRLALSSAPGRGTTVTITLPVAAEHASPSPAGVETEPSGERRSILVVDDESSVRRVTATMLTQLGYRVYETGDPRAAEQLVARADPPLSLLVCDVVMPELSGPGLARQLRAHHPHLAVLFVSGHHQHSEGDDAVPEGAAFLAKPFDRAALAQAVKRAMDPASARDGSR